jgi:hypothetical protein
MMRNGVRMKRALIAVGVGAVVLVGLIPAATAQEITGGCNATVNGSSVDTLTITNPLVEAKGDTVDLTGSVPASAGSGRVESETRIFVEVVGDVPLATESGTGPFWGGNVTVPNLLTQLAPGVYRVKGTATGSGWICTGSAYVKVEGGPLTAATAVGVVAVGSGIVAAIGARRPKQGQVFSEAAGPPGGGAGSGPDGGARLTADVATLGLFALLVALVGFVGPSWVL